MSNKKNWKLVGLEKALDGLPPAERAGVAAEIEEMFRDSIPRMRPAHP